MLRVVGDGSKGVAAPQHGRLGHGRGPQPARARRAPARFFRSCLATYRPDPSDPLRGHLRYPADQWGAFDAELDVEYAPRKWYPLSDGALPAHDPQGFAKLLGRKTHWRDMPP
jgi:hypothetical protein